MTEELNKKTLTVTPLTTIEPNSSTTTDITSNDTIFDESTKQALQKLLHVIIAALQEYADPLSINVGEFLDQLNTLQKTLTQESDLFHVILVISALTDLREKQDNHILQLLRGNMEILDKLLFQAFYQVLHLPGLQLYQLGIKIFEKNGCYKQPALSKKYFPVDTLQHKIMTGSSTEMLAQINWTPLVNIDRESLSKPESKPVQVLKVKQKGKLQWKEELHILYQQLPDNKVVNASEWVIQPTYQESLKRLQALSYFIAKNTIILSIDEHKTDFEKYLLMKTNKKENEESIILKGEALVFNLTYTLWEQYNTAKHTRKQLEMEVIHT